MKKKLLLIALSVFLAADMTSFATSIGANEKPISISSTNQSCISGYFVAREDGDIIGTILLNSNCTFTIADIDGNEVTKTTGTYSIDGTVSRGQMADINFYVNGSFSGSARIVWPEEEDLCIILNGYLFRKE